MTTVKLMLLIKTLYNGISNEAYLARGLIKMCTSLS